MERGGAERVDELTPTFAPQFVPPSPSWFRVPFKTHPSCFPGHLTPIQGSEPEQTIRRFRERPRDYQ